MRVARAFIVASLGVLVAILVVASGIAGSGLRYASASPSAASSSRALGEAPATAHLQSLLKSLAVKPAFSWQDLFPAPAFCYVTATFLFGLFGPSCGYAAAFAQWEAFASSVEMTSDVNLMTLLSNSLNITNAFVSDLNATAQELLSYFEQRAEAIVPYFLNGSWTPQVYDQIATYSGLVPAIEGMEMAYATQEYQDWNATKMSWANLYGPSGTFHANRASLEINNTGDAGAGLNNTFGGVIVSSASSGTGILQITAPSEAWSGATPAGFSNSTYFNLMPGGSIYCVTDLIPSTGSTQCPTFKVSDYTNSSVHSFNVSLINRSQWFNETGVPSNLTTARHIGPFDLLLLQCIANCSRPNKFVQVQGGYAFRNATALNPDFNHPLSASGYGSGFHMTHDSMIPEISLGSSNYTAVQVPSLAFTLCVHEGDGNIQGHCSTPKAPTEGRSNALGSGPGSVAGSNNSLTRFASTMQSLVNNTLVMAHIDFVTLRTATKNGTYAIPANCAIPLPSSAFPAAFAPADYLLNFNEGLATYWSYLLAVGKAFGFTTPVSGISFCGNPHLAIGFNWSGSWKLALNISASVYLGAPNGTGLFINGTFDPNATYSNPATWPIRNVKPILLFPEEFQTNVKPNVIYPIPFNDPLVADLVNYSGNALFGTSGAGPGWGVPTYLQLAGYGNAIFVSGAISNLSANRTLSSGDAIDIQSCSLNGSLQNPCKLAVTYFNNFTYGHVTGLVGPISPPSLGGGTFFGGSVGQACGVAGFNSWYDQWFATVVVAVGSIFSAGASIPFGIGSFLVSLGCFVGYIVAIVIVILLIALFAYIFGKSIPRGRSAPRASPAPSGNGNSRPIHITVKTTPSGGRRRRR